MVYFIQAEQTKLIKIGSIPPKSLSKRINQLKSENADSLKLLGVTNDFSELVVRATFESCRHHSNWYSPSPALIDFINNKISKGSGIPHKETLSGTKEPNKDSGGIP